MEIEWILGLGAIAAILGVTCWYVYTFLRDFDLFLGQFLESFIHNCVEKPELQENIFKVGGILGSGLKAGVGLNIPKGRTNLKSIAMDLLGQFLQNKVGDFIQNPSPSPAPQPYLTDQKKDKFFNT
jgi:hypothetical protein